MTRYRLGALWVALLLFLTPFGAAQPGPPHKPPGPPEGRGPDQHLPEGGFDPARVLEVGQALLEGLVPLAIFEHVHGKRDEKREVWVLLGDEAGVYGRFTLDPTTLEPVPIGLEGVTPPLPVASDPHAFFQAAEAAAQELSLSAVVVPEREGYKLLLVYAGRIVGELNLNHDYTPIGDKGWLEAFGRSRWRFPN